MLARVKRSSSKKFVRSRDLSCGEVLLASRLQLLSIVIEAMEEVKLCDVAFTKRPVFGAILVLFSPACIAIVYVYM